MGQGSAAALEPADVSGKAARAISDTLLTIVPLEQVSSGRNAAGHAPGA